MHDLIKMDLFNSYMVRQISTMNSLVTAMLHAGEYEQMRGALRLAKVLLTLPGQMCKDDDVAARTEENRRRFESGFLMGTME